MGIFHSILFAFVQAATEFLPISSSGHLLFIKGLFHSQDVPVLFDITLHVGSLTAILLYYHKRIIRTFKLARVEIQDKKIEKPNTLFLVYLMISTGVTFGCYLLFKDTIDILYKNPSILSGAYVITSIILFSTFFVRSSDKHVTVGQRGFLLPLVVGILQGLAILPGISRSGATISPLLHWRIHREDAAFYSFSLAVPAITGALIFELFELESIHFLKEFWFMVIISFIASVFFSIIFLSLLRLLLVRDKFWMFSIYTLGLAIAAFMVFK